jgi:hypothetical protein
MKKIEDWRLFKNIQPHMVWFFWWLSLLFIISGFITFFTNPLWVVLVWFFCAFVQGMYGYISYQKGKKINKDI